ncbi:MAG: S41 family peptidase [Parvularculaceae bacterium]
MSKSSASLMLAAAALALTIAPVLTACSGGGGAGGGRAVSPPPPPPPPPPPGGSGPTWTNGVFAAASSFKSRCEAPRSGVDSEGNAFNDIAGSTLEENFWLRSWTNETYLWNNEVVDQDPANFTDRIVYFDQLRTTAVTVSGEDKDDFHFSQSTEAFLESRNSAPSSSYGVSYVSFSSSVPRDFRIRYTEPNSPASAIVGGLVNFPRGAKILEVDGQDLINGGDTAALNDGLFPATAGETHTFLIQDVGATSSRTVTLVSQDLARKPVNRMKTIDTGSGKVGYILFNTFSPFSSERDIAEAITAMQAEGINDLVLDLRYNGGGLLTVAAQLGYMIAGDAPTAGRTFELLRFNADAGNTNPVTGATNSPIPFVKTGVGFSLTNGTPLDSLDLPRVFILSTSRTCSASEAVINGLRGIDIEVVLIGDTTCGKPYGFYPQDNCGETFYTIQFQGVNDKNFGDYSDGFVPLNSSFAFGEKLNGCVVADDFDHELGDEAESLLAAALDYRATGTCPAVIPKRNPKITYRNSGKTEVASSDLTQAEAVMQNNRDMRLRPE